MQFYGILTTLDYSKYSSPIFAQRKPNGDLRILFDLRRINHLLRHDYDDNNFPVASMEEAQTHLANKKFFSKLDATQAYHAVKLADERSIQLLSFNFESRVFAYTRLAQGLNRASTAFSSFVRQHLAADIAADRAASFMDDICSATETFPQHLDALDHIFASIRRSGLRLSMKKCEFGVAEIKFLGWTVSKHGIGTQKEKIDATAGHHQNAEKCEGNPADDRLHAVLPTVYSVPLSETATVLQTHQTWKPVQGRAGTPRRAGTAEKRPEKRHAENAAFTTRRETVRADDGCKRVGGRIRADGRGLHEEPRRKGDKDVRTSRIWVPKIHPGTIQPRLTQKSSWRYTWRSTHSHTFSGES